AAVDLAVAGPRRETIRSAEARVEAARGSLAAAESLLAQARVAAPGDGRVSLRNAEPGEVVTPGFPILRIAELGRVWLRVYVPETRIGLVKPGQRAAVSVDAFPGRSFPGVVAEIAEKPEFTPKNVQTREERVKLVFGVKVEIENPGGELKPGMPADAVITVR
ncbi:MAG TPA: efflux RND transporter periplasmic adaptor subunit, partial [bacterium]